MSCSPPLQCLQGPAGANPLGPFWDFNWYLYTPPPGSPSHLVWGISLVATSTALFLGAVGTILFGLMASGKGLDRKIGRYASMATGTAAVTAILASVTLLAWLWEQGSVWGSGVDPASGGLNAVWGPGLGWYLCIASALVLSVLFVLARRDLGEGERFYEGRAGSRARKSRRHPADAVAGRAHL